MKKLFKDIKGATAIEYALIAALLSIAIIVGVSAVGTSVGSNFSEVSIKVDDAM